jgi:signal transduction histidine kinase
MNRVNLHFQEIRIRSEFKEKYYLSLIRHSGIGLIVLTSGNEIELMNEMACKYAGISPDTVNFRILKTKNPAFYEAVNSLKPGENITYKNIIHNNFQLLFFRATRVRKRDHTVKLVSIEDIRSEMESRELESYRKLISVLTHEIMNLLSPLTSVSKALRTLFYSGERPKSHSEIDEDTLKATLNGIQIIEEQSSGMMNFVNNYRKISKIPQPEMKEFLVQEWMEQLKIVFNESLASSKIRFDIAADKGIRYIVADRKLINQVMINIINNAVDAIADQEGERMIRIRIFQNRMNRLLIEVFNNGPHIPPEIQEKIFVPFFTTRKKGSGIGLSISQEIMKLHKGSLRVMSNKEHGTSFILEL